MALTVNKIYRVLNTLVEQNNGVACIREENVDTAIQRITASSDRCYALVKPVGKIGKKLVIGNAVSKMGKPLVELFIRNDI